MAGPFFPFQESLYKSIRNDIPLTSSKVASSFLSYLLFFTDIPRSGYGFKSLPVSYYKIDESSYAYWGPYNYSIINMDRYKNGSVISSLQSNVPVWPYKFDTCSIGIRSLVQHLSIPGWDVCLSYNQECSGNGLSTTSVFTMLDNFITTMMTVPALTLRVEHLYTDKLHEFLAPNLLFSEREWRTVRSHILTSAVDLCHPLSHDRALLCDQAWADFSTLGPIAQITSITKHVQERMAMAVNQLNLSTQIVEMVVVECSVDLRPWDGGVTITKSFDFDIVTFLRIQNCTDTTKTNCTSISISDYRYEGTILSTSICYWYRLVQALRLVGQCYNIVRVIVLIGGCYYAHVQETAFQYASFVEKTKRVIGTFLRIPAQVIIYGSWFPVLLFVSAHAIDCTTIYLLIFRAFTSLNGGLQLNPEYAYFLLTMMACQMRSVWVLSITTKTLLYSSDQHCSSRKLLGFRGYVLPLVSFFYMGFCIRLISIRNSNVLKHVSVVESYDIGAIRHSHTIPTNYRYWGIFLDARCLFMAFIVLYILIRVMRARAVRSQTLVPYAVKLFCNHTMFSTSWNTLLLDQLDPDDSMNKTVDIWASKQILFVHQGRRVSEHILMNIAWMTDPIEFLSIQYWNSYVVFYYRDKSTDLVFLHPLGIDDLKQLVECVGDTIELVEHEKLANIPWTDRINCC
ncbi:hypothetical protein THRCLA_12029 [Thraustotheca clavata]|uniref:Transmembrane protein n=1 Tax=Thraustotheca clavata TaxID=74557 RepID=A0A1V9Y489_9STRA|nr:hypothetical protein THRCLA_12029 [Thraustotheca clavata]